MNEEKKSRSLEEIQQEYQNLCLKAGHLQYQISAISKDLELVNGQLREINFEAAAVQAKAQPAPVVSEVPPVAEVSSG